MKRLFIIMGLGLALNVTIACDGGSKRPVKLNKKGAVDGRKNLDEDILKLVDKASDRNCFRVDRFFNGLTKLKNKDVVYYVRGRDIGMLKPATQKTPAKFTTELDSSSRAVHYLGTKEQRDFTQAWVHKVKGENFQRIEDIALNFGSMDDACKSVELTNLEGAKSQWTVTFKTAKRLDIQKNGAAGNTISYELTDSGHLLMTQYRRAGSSTSCGAIHASALEKHSSAIILGKKREMVSLEPELVDTLMEVMEGNPELTKFHSSNGSQVEMKLEQYEKILTAVRESKKTPSCQ